jgi:N-acyl-D-aspartate/D-glutamate deacylase
MVVCPGFIDMHTHCDDELGNPECRANLNYLIQGVTTVVTGNCGESVSLGVLKTKEKWEKQGIGTHVVFLVGHGNIRRKVMGNAPRKAAPGEIEKMKILVGNAMKEGAWGMSTGLEYAPGRFSDTEEVIALTKVVGQYHGVYTSHMRDEAARIVEAIEETVRIAGETGVRTDISHLKVTGKNNWGLMEQAVKTIVDARKEGIYVVADQYPYIQSAPIGLLSTFVEIPGSIKRLAGLREKIDKNRWWEADWDSLVAAYHKELIKALKNKKKRNRIKVLTLKGRPNDPSPVAMWGWHDFNVLVAVKNRQLVGKNFTELGDRDDVIFDRVVQLILEEPDILYGGGSQSVEDHAYALRQDFVMVSSDGAAHAVRGDGVKAVRDHPRDFGSQTRVLRRFVREEKLLTCEDAVRKMTSLPASFLQMKKRGLLKEGFKADVVVFDPHTVRDNATYADSRRYSSGVYYVLSDGKISIDRGKYHGALNGRVLLLTENH